MFHYYIDFVKYSWAHMSERIGLFILILVQCFFLGCFSEETRVFSILLVIAAHAIALSRFGNWMMRIICGAKPITRMDYKAFLDPIFEKALTAARETGIDLPEHIELYMTKDREPYAYAIGMEAICISRGLLEMPQEMIELSLIHELYHIHKRDPESLGIAVNGTILLFWFLVPLFVIGWIFSKSRRVDDADGGLFIMLCTAALAGVLTLLMLAVRQDLRKNDLEADAYTCQCGYGYILCNMIDHTRGLTGDGFAQALHFIHADADDRIGNLQAMGVCYM